MRVLWTVVSLGVIFSGDYVKAVDINDVDMTGWTPFNCNRGARGCFDDGTCNSDGSCACNGGTRPGIYDCSIPDVTLTCTKDCNEHGTCYIVDGEDTCYCEREYAGTDCDRARGYVECTDGSMSIEIYPQSLPDSDFNGKITVQRTGTNEALSNDACVTEITEPGVWNRDLNRFRSVYSTRDSVGNPCRDGLQLTPTEDGLQACYNVRLWYSPSIQTYLDEVFTLCCTENTNINDGQANVGNGDENDSGARVNGTIEIVSGNLIYTDSGNTVDPGDTLSVGDRISFVVDIVQDSSRYTVVRVNSCTATPGNIPLVTGRCRDPGALGLVTELRQVGTAVYVDMRAWNPEGNDLITITCDTEACVDETACGGAATQCPGETSFDFGRKKRQADQASDDRETFTRTATYSIKVNVDSCPAQEPCPMRADVNNIFIPVAVVFGVLLIVVFGISIFLCLRLRRSDRSPARDHPPAYVNHAMNKA